MSLNENFEYSYRLNQPVLGVILKEHCALTMLNMIVQRSPFKTLCLASIGMDVLQENHVIKGQLYKEIKIHKMVISL